MSKQDHILTVEVVDQDGSTFTLREICERGECHDASVCNSRYVGRFGTAGLYLSTIFAVRLR